MAKKKKKTIIRVEWHTSVIPAFGRLRQKKYKFKARMGHIIRSCLKTKQNEQMTTEACFSEGVWRPSST
jgi:ubiquinone/menaquinone biosynthesis C-methylase UbiE